MNPAQAAAVPSSGPPLSPQRWSIQADVHRMLATRGLAPVTLLVCQFVTPPEKSMKPHYVLAAKPAPSWLQASVGASIHFIDLADVIYFCADAKYTRVVTDTMEAHIRLSLKELAEALDGAAFWQVHRRYMVAVKRIASATRGEDGGLWVQLRGHAARVPVSQRFQYLFRGM